MTIDSGLVTIIVAFIAAVGSAYSVWATRKKTEAETGSVLVDAASDVVALLREQVSLLSTELTETRRELERARRRVSELESAIEKLQMRLQELEGVKPTWD